MEAGLCVAWLCHEKCSAVKMKGRAGIGISIFFYEQLCFFNRQSLTRSASVQPIVQEPSNSVFGTALSGNFAACSYFLALPGPAAPEAAPAALSDIVSIERAKPLLKLLLSNERNEDMRVLLENCCNSLGDYIGVPVVASALTAMTLGFFAFKPGQASGGEESQSLQLVQIDSLELLDARPPNPHPLCSFWLVKPAGLLRLIDEKTATVTVKEYKMKVSLMAEFISHTSLLEMHHKLRLQHHKRRLEDVIQDLEADLEEKKAEVKILEKKLRPDPEDQPAQELDVSES